MPVSDLFFAVFLEAALSIRDSWMVALRHVYFDESGTHDGSRVLTMAGYIFTAEQAARFSRDWSKELKRFGLPYAHMADSTLGFSHYEHLDREERIRFNTLLIENIKRRTLLGFSVTVDPHHYNEVLGSEAGMPTAYSFCVLACVNAVRDWIEKTAYNGKISYFFEAGHQNQGEAHFIMNGIPEGTRNQVDDFRYLSHSFFDKTEAPPLQAADMLAWQVHHYLTRKRDKGIERGRADFRALVRPWDYNRDYTRATLEDFKNLLLLKGGQPASVLPVDP